MSKQELSVLPFNAEIQRKRRDKRLARRRESATFKEHLRMIRARIGGGQSLTEIRETIGIKSESMWDDLVASLSLSYVNPANMLLEWQIRQQTRYTQTAKLMKMADENPNKTEAFDQLLKAILAAAKVDENMLELQKALGMIRPIKDLNTDGEGFSSDDIELAKERFNRTVEERIINKLGVERISQSADTVDVFPGASSRREADQVGSSSLDKNTAD